MKRKILLVEPKYKNKYPPLGLMKLATYHKMLNDEVYFFKGTFKEFVVEEIFSELIKKLYINNSEVDWYRYKKTLKDYIVRGQTSDFEQLNALCGDAIVARNLKYYKDYYRGKKYLEAPKWDRICISTLFTFCWKDTVEAINQFKTLCKDINEVWVGGVAASVVPEEIYNETEIYPHVGLLDKPGVLDENDIVIDHLPLDYSILNEIDYVYPENNGYYGYMTRGCVNKCSFCAVPQIEPYFNDYISIKQYIKHIKSNFGEKQNLLLLDNNVLASKKFNQIIDEIKDCGFTLNSRHTAVNEYVMAIKGLKSGISDRGYVKKIIKLYKKLLTRLGRNDKKRVYELLEQYKLLNHYTATKGNLLNANDTVAPLFEKYFKPVQSLRKVDFNQGIDARLLTEEKAKKLSEIPIKPLRIAFDTWRQRDIYENAVRLCSKYGIKEMSNYLLYNYDDKPVDLYNRLKLNVELCEELDVNIYSFPMKYHPIKDKRYFKERTYLGKNWNRKYIRAVQAVLNATKGKIGRGASFFYEAFGNNQDEFYKLLYMPEALIIFRLFYKGNGITDAWWNKFCSLNENQLLIAKEIIHSNDFNGFEENILEPAVLEVLKYYQITRVSAEEDIKLSKENLESKEIQLSII